MRPERNVPIPPVLRRTTVYGWPDLKVGESLFHETDKPQNARAAAHAYARNHGKKFVTRTEPGGVRVWCVDPGASRGKPEPKRRPDASKYHWYKMKPGDSVFFQGAFRGTKVGTSATMTEPGISALQYGRRMRQEFRVAEENGGVRVWRTT